MKIRICRPKQEKDSNNWYDVKVSFHKDSFPKEVEKEIDFEDKVINRALEEIKSDYMGCLSKALFENEEFKKKFLEAVMGNQDLKEILQKAIAIKVQERFERMLGY